MAIPIGNIPPEAAMAIEDEKLEQKRMWHRFRGWWKEENQLPCAEFKEETDKPRPSLGRRLSRKIGTGLPMVNLPRPTTFRRQNSERRERLTLIERVPPRTVSVDRKRAMSARPASPRPIAMPKLSAPAVCNIDSSPLSQISGDGQREPHNDELGQTANPLQLPPPNLPPSPPPDFPRAMSEASYDDQLDEKIQAELEEKWILNLSMHFRDKSPREKFFVTYAETPIRWRRVTVSCDYRDAPPESLERDLQALQYQRDKSARIYEAIRMSLPDIQFYDAVTNLKLETSQDGRLHVHVTEDVNEIIPYPSTSAVQHLKYKRVPETDVNFVQHMSGFVYKVSVNGHVCIKKEIPGPDSVEEFLYEINALYALQGSKNVIHFQGLVVDEKNELVKGLLISFAEKGPLVDMIFDYKTTLDWERRERWAKQIVHGLSEIHEAGFVQGDFTLSNIVVDENDTAQIIDINRRGCPVGWEPPEIARLIESGQRISIYIGVKSDLFQLGMVLWALAEEEDEPERRPRPLSLRDSKKDIPQYFRDLAARCLSANPQDRHSAAALLNYFPTLPTEPSSATLIPSQSLNTHRTNSRSHPSETHYIDPSQAVEREDLLFHAQYQHDVPHDFSSPSHTYISRHSSLDLPFDNTGSYMVSRRGRAPPLNIAHLDPPYPQSHDNNSPTRSDDEAPQIVPVSPGGDRKWEEISVDGEDYIVQRESLDADETERERFQRRMRSMQRMRDLNIGNDTPGAEGRSFVPFEHVDSGLGPDMEVLVGFGGNEALVWDEGQRSQWASIGGLGVEDEDKEEAISAKKDGTMRHEEKAKEENPEGKTNDIDSHNSQRDTATDTTTTLG